MIKSPNSEDSETGHEDDLEDLPMGSGEASLPPATPVRETEKPRRTGLWFGVAFLIVAVILGVTLGLTLPKDNDSSGLQQQEKSITDEDEDIGSVAAPTPPPTSTPLDPVQKWLTEQGIADAATLLEEGSYQNRAASWLLDQGNTTTDHYQISVPGEAYDQVVRYALACLYYATNPDRSTWLKSVDFLTEKPVCEWQDRNFLGEVIGVGCDEETGLVDSIRLDFNGLSGELVPELALIWSLRVLDLEYNSLVGTIPTELAEMPVLRSLILGHNDNMQGPIPPGLGSNGLFRVLDLSNNTHTGMIPLSLQQSASTMRLLSLNDNQLSGDINFLTAFKNLTHAFLDDNAFSGSMEGDFLATADKLKILDLSDNLIQGPIHENLFALPSLETLDLHGNAFTSLPNLIPLNQNLGFLALHENELAGKVPESIINLEVLYHLDLSQNAFTGDMPTDLPSDLTYLFLAANDFKSGPIPDNYASLTALRELSLKSTNRTGPIPSLFATSLEDLILLDLDDNALSGKIPSFSGNQTMDLYALLLNRNQLTGTVPSSLRTLESLRLFFVDGNAVTGSLDESLCSLPQFVDASGGLPVTADCEEVDCDCCTICCVDDDVTDGGEDCHDNDLVASTDPTWERDYRRPEFAFGDDLVLGPA